MADKKAPLKEVPQEVRSPESGAVYIRGKFLGKGGFARCYELINSVTKETYAGKIVSKTLLTKSYQKDKMAQEISIHRGLSHPNVVRLDMFFEDPDNVYILLELCPRRSLMELHKRRKAVTEPEARYFTSHVVEGVRYLHEKKIIHRDLKLGNLFLNDDMVVKVGDFGLATTIEFDGERKKTLCGTPNYIAPEVLDKKGHSFEVDIWAIGCILYTLLIGKPPFETNSLKDTYARIKANQYRIPPHIDHAAQDLITRLLAGDPKQRPSIQDVKKVAFFTKGYMPSRLPTSCLTMAPKFTRQQDVRGAGDDARGGSSQRSVLSPRQPRVDMVVSPRRFLNSVPENKAVETEKAMSIETVNPETHLSTLYEKLTSLVNAAAQWSSQNLQEEEAEDPASTPIFWVSKWVDYSDKYGLGYMLSDNSVGVLYNDSTKLVFDAAGKELQYTERDGVENYFTPDSAPPQLKKKLTLLSYFRSYMNEHLIKAGANLPVAREGDELARLPYLRHWFRTRSAIVLHLSNGTIQLNFFQDHTKLIICPLMEAVTYIDQKKDARTFKMELIEKYGCRSELVSRLRYARTMVQRLLSSSNSSRPGALSTVGSRSKSDEALRRGDAQRGVSSRH